MKTSPTKRWKSGFVSYVVVISTGVVLTLLTVYAYRQAVRSRSVQAKAQLRVDYAEKQEAILRSIVAITPNRAIRAMRWDANSSVANANSLRWENVFAESLTLANAGTSISPALINSLNIPSLRISNTGDSANLVAPASIIGQTTHANGNTPAGLITSGLNRTAGNALPIGYPTSLLTDGTAAGVTTLARDSIYPIISNNKRYSIAPTASRFNQLKYPNINFGYSNPGDDFVAKRNWWSFSMDIADQDDAVTRLAISRRNFVLSIYEIPSQLALSAASFMSMGRYENAAGSAWQNVNISGPVFAGRAEVDGTSAITTLSSRRGMTELNGATVRGQALTNAFAPGAREAFLMNQGAFFPVSLASESGRAAFVPINRGIEFFDRFHPENLRDETGALSTTTWNNYTVGAMQAAMRLDIVGVVSAIDRTPTMLRFSYLLPNGERVAVPKNIPIMNGRPVLTQLPPGFTKVANENQSFTFTTPVDIAYGMPGGYIIRSVPPGTINFNNATFGDPLFGVSKEGYSRPQTTQSVRDLQSLQNLQTTLATRDLPSNGQKCVAINPQRIGEYLASIGGGSTAINNSIVINVDYSNTGLNDNNFIPSNQCTDNDYGVILKECTDMTSFPTGFSIVTNLRLYIGEDFNIVSMAPPVGYNKPEFFPPCSIFAPEKRFGVEQNTFRVELEGQIGSLAAVDRVNATDPNAPRVRPLDTKNRAGTPLPAGSISANLRAITHPLDLPPITMMNWLILLEERRNEFH